MLLIKTVEIKKNKFINNCFTPISLTIINNNSKVDLIWTIIIFTVTVKVSF